MLEAIRAGAPISRAEISRRAGISKPTVSLALQSLLDAGLVREADRASRTARATARSSSSRCPRRRSCSGSTSARGSCAARSATCAATSARARTSRSTGSDAERVLDQIAALRERLVAATRPRRHAPDRRRRRRRAGRRRRGAPRDRARDERRRARGRHVRRATSSERLGLPVTLENDVNLAALGEHWQGVARGVDDFVFLSIGTGMGAGLVLRGELHRGHNGAAGEVDFALVGLGAGRRPVRRRGVGVRRAARRGARRGDDDAARRRSTRARSSPRPARATRSRGEVVDEVARRIALHIVPIAAVTDVSLVVLGGGLGANGDLLLEPVRELLAQLDPVSAAGRGLEPRRGGRADRRARLRAAPRARQRRRATPRSVPRRRRGAASPCGDRLDVAAAEQHERAAVRRRRGGSRSRAR